MKHNSLQKHPTFNPYILVSAYFLSVFISKLRSKRRFYCFTWNIFTRARQKNRQKSAAIRTNVAPRFELGTTPKALFSMPQLYLKKNKIACIFVFFLFFSPIFRQKGSNFAIFDAKNAVLSQSERGFVRLSNREVAKGYNVSRETIRFNFNHSHIKFAPLWR